MHESSPDDKQIDAIHIDENASTIYIIQGKFIGSETTNAEPLREVLASWAQLKNLVALQESSNNKLKQKLSDVADSLQEDYDVCFELITTSTLTESAKNDLRAFQETLANSEDLSATLQLIDNDELKRRYDLALDKENPYIKHTIKLPDVNVNTKDTKNAHIKDTTFKPILTVIEYCFPVFDAPARSFQCKYLALVGKPV